MGAPVIAANFPTAIHRPYAFPNRPLGCRVYFAIAVNGQQQMMPVVGVGDVPPQIVQDRNCGPPRFRSLTRPVYAPPRFGGGERSAESAARVAQSAAS